MKETQIMRAIRHAVNQTGRARLVRNNVGVDIERGIKFGLGVGSADLVGMLRGGRTFAIEVKTDVGRLSKEQQAWWRAFRAWGGLGGMARNEEQAMQLLEEAEMQAAA